MRSARKWYTMRFFSRCVGGVASGRIGGGTDSASRNVAEAGRKIYKWPRSGEKQGIVRQFNWPWHADRIFSLNVTVIPSGPFPNPRRRHRPSHPVFNFYFTSLWKLIAHLICPISFPFLLFFDCVLFDMPFNLASPILINFCPELTRTTVPAHNRSASLLPTSADPIAAPPPYSIPPLLGGSTKAAPTPTRRHTRICGAHERKSTCFFRWVKSV
ncbi:hypothetical protein C8R43DRAFT_211139 [Mycena crocata]|nr:hypothetical protein C8R43DRAFT_211139 [Mycena crocata]